MCVWPSGVGDPSDRIKECSIQVDLRTSVVDPVKVCTMKVDDDGNQLEEWAKALVAYKTSLGETLNTKKADAAKVMDKKNWKSVLYRFDSVVQGAERLKLTDHDSNYMDDAGASPWLMTIRPSTWRYGPKDFPLPGCVFFYLSLDCDVFLIVYDLQPLVSQGISVADLASFAESPSGGDYFVAHTVVIAVRKGEVAFVPYGHVASVLYSASKEEEKDQPVASGLVLTCFSRSLASDVDENAWKSITALNTKWHDKNSTNRLWKQRIDLYARFLASVAEYRSTHGRT